MRNVSDKICRENENTHFVLNFFYSCPLCGNVGNVQTHCGAGQATDDNVIWRMGFQRWITKATNTHSEYVICIDFSTAAMLIRELASTLRYMCIACLV